MPEVFNSDLYFSVPDRREPGEAFAMAYDQLIASKGKELGLNADEIRTLTSLCGGLGGYSSYEDLRAVSENLAKSYPDVCLETIGHSSDYPDKRPVDLTVIGDPDGSGGRAFVKGPGHANEPGGAQSTSVLEQLFSVHPNLMRRLGYSCVLACSRIDPDGMCMQRWPMNRRASLREYVDGAYRGSWRDQVTWGYPTDGYRNIKPEVQALLHVIDVYAPDFVGAMHTSLFWSYVITAQHDPRIAQLLSEVLGASGLPINLDEPENSSSPVLAPGVFGTTTAETFKKARTSYIPGKVVSDVRDGGTSIVDHLPATTKLYVPEISMLVSDIPPGNPSTSATYLGMVEYRLAAAQQVIDGIGVGLSMLGNWPEQYQDKPEIRRLYDAARWWHNTVPHSLMSAAEKARQNPRAHEVLKQAEFAMRIGMPICNSLIYAGNVRRLAEAAKRPDVVRHMVSVRDRGLEALGPATQVDVRLQVATQVLAVLAGMRRETV